MKKRRLVSLKSTILIYTVIPVAVSFLIISTVMFTALFNSFKETARAESLLKGQEYAGIFENKISSALDYLSTASVILKTEVDSQVADRKKTQELFLNIFDDYGLIDGTSIMFERNMFDGKDDEFVGSEYGTVSSGKICWYFYTDEGETAYVPEALENEIEFELPHYTDAKDTGKPIYTDPVVYEVSGKAIPMFTITYPLHDDNGTFLGAVTVDLFLKELYELMQNEKIYDTGYIVISNDKNQVICGPVFEDIGKTREEAGLDYVLPVAGETVVYSNAPSLINNKNCLMTTVSVYIPQLDSYFYISVAVPTNEVYSSGIRLLFILAGLSTLIVIVIGLIIFYLIDKATNPIKEITKSATRIVDGTIDEDVLFKAIDENADTMDEVQSLAVSIKKILVELNSAQKAKLESLEMKHKKEKAEAEVRAKSDFLAKMSHEIRTPMNAIMGMSELILREQLPRDVYDNALTIKSASSNLLSIINDILDFSKIESGKMEIAQTDYLFASLINDVISIIRMRMMDKPVLFAVNIDSRIPASLTGDEVRIRQILLNLLSNAVKYTPKGVIALEITGELQDDNVILSINISDSGVGIKEEDIGKLFGDFVQFDLTKNKGIEGTGLGLAITQNLCRIMGGDISVKSEYGKGSTFTVTLPQKFNSSEPFASVENPDEKSVLLYESRDIYANSIARTLVDLGVYCKSIQTVSALYDDLEHFSYVFVSSFLYDSIKPVLEKLAKPPILVLLTDNAISLVPMNAVVLSVPVHALSAANVLNNIYEDISAAHESGVSFTAPEARVLIVDDIEANLKVGEGLLAPYGMQVDLSRNGKDAVEKVELNRYDLVFMDHMMPEMDGIQATEHIRAMQGEYYQTLPIIALTANAVSGVREMFIQNGMSDFLAKPIETAKLDAILKKWIPREKRGEAMNNVNAEQTEKARSFVSKLRDVPGLFIDKALNVVGGSAEAYESVFKLTIRLLPENVVKLNNLLETDLPLYAIEVHGVKGVLNNIGAYALGDMALELEKLSKAGDWDACNTLHPAFNEALAEFLKTALPLAGNTPAADRPTGDRESLLQALPDLENAANLFDSTLALEILSPIQTYTYGQDFDKGIAELVDAFEQFDFDKAVEIVQHLKEQEGSDG